MSIRVSAEATPNMAFERDVSGFGLVFRFARVFSFVGFVAASPLPSTFDIMRIERRLITIFALAVFAVGAVQADAPLPRSVPHEVVSRNNAYTVASSPTKGTRVFNKATNQEIWSMAGWYRWIFVSNDGNYVVTGYDGMNLIPLSHADDLVLLTFWKKGKLIRRVTLKEIVPNKSIMVRTVSHYLWGTIEGINDKGRLVVKRSDGKILLFDVSTGIQQ